MAEKFNAPHVPASTEEGPSKRIVKIWKKSSGTKKYGDLEPSIYALFDVATWVASEVDAIKCLADPHPALKAIRTDVTKMAQRLSREFGQEVVRVGEITVQVNDGPRRLRAGLNLAKGTWWYSERWAHRQGFTLRNHGRGATPTPAPN